MAKKQQSYSLSEHIKTELRLRMASGTSMLEIAREAGIQHPTLSYWLSGERETIKLATADKLCEYLGLVLRNR